MGLVPDVVHEGFPECYCIMPLCANWKTMEQMCGFQWDAVATVTHHPNSLLLGIIIVVIIVIIAHGSGVAIIVNCWEGEIMQAMVHPVF